MQISYSIRKNFQGHVSFGKLLIASTSRGICFLGISNSEQKLLYALRQTYKKAVILLQPSSQNHKMQSDIFASILDYLNNCLPLNDLPLDLHGTEFQLRVWKQLLTIKHGTTSSYSEIAKQIGSPKAVRAVSRAIAQNPVAVIIPCHRIIGKNGKLTGYRWGLSLKQKLLNQEKRLKAHL